MEKVSELNQYDRCWENTLVNVKLYTLVRYVEDNKVSHMEAELLEDLIRDLRKHFGELVVTRGKEYTFLCMDINITENKKVEIDMKEKLLEAIEASGENIDEKVTTPESSHIFLVNEQAKQLDEEKRESFHLVVANLL